jgi:excisionase family DNA binding protein
MENESHLLPLENTSSENHTHTSTLDISADNRFQLLTVAEVAKILRSNKNYIYDLIRCGQLKATKIGQYKVRLSSLEEFLDASEGYDFTDPANVSTLHLAS